MLKRIRTKPLASAIKIINRFHHSAVFLLLFIPIFIAIIDTLSVALLLEWINVKSGYSAEKNAIFSLIFHSARDYPAVVLLGFVLKGSLIFFNGFFRYKIQQNVVRNLREACFKGLSDFSFEKFSQKSTGEHQNLMTSEIDRFQTGILNLFQMAEFLIISLAYVVIAFSINASFSTGMLISGLILFYSINYLSRNAYKYSIVLSKRNSDLYQSVSELISSFRYIKITGRSEIISKRFAQINKQIVDVRLRLGNLISRVEGFREPTAISLLVGLIFGMEALGISMSGLQVLLLVFYRALTTMSAFNLAKVRYDEVSGSIQNVSDNLFFYNQRIDCNDRIPSTEFKSLEIYNLSFGFSKMKPLFKNLSFTIEKGDFLVIVGESGKGKSTLVDTLLGVRKALEGTITYVDQKNIQYVNKEIGPNVGYIPQEPCIFTGTLFENISFWDVDSMDNRNKCINLLESVNLLEYFNSLEEGLDTQIDLSGNISRLSGGQKQRIAIARELYQNKEILILDEPTSSLDINSELIVMDLLKMLNKTKTLIMITHNHTFIDDSMKIIKL